MEIIELKCILFSSFGKIRVVGVFVVLFVFRVDRFFKYNGGCIGVGLEKLCDVKSCVERMFFCFFIK